MTQISEPTAVKAAADVSPFDLSPARTISLQTTTSTRRMTMQSYLIERNFGHVTDEQVARTASTCKRIAAEQFADAIVWKHSHATQSDSGLTTHCLYEATDEAVIRAHAEAAGIPCDSITPATVIGPDDFA